jgi:hypothetical protein
VEDSEYSPMTSSAKTSRQAHPRVELDRHLSRAQDVIGRRFTTAERVGTLEYRIGDDAFRELEKIRRKLRP